jgi:hypothetical protein
MTDQRPALSATAIYDYDDNREYKMGNLLFSSNEGKPTGNRI